MRSLRFLPSLWTRTRLSLCPTWCPISASCRTLLLQTVWSYLAMPWWKGTIRRLHPLTSAPPLRVWSTWVWGSWIRQEAMLCWARPWGWWGAQNVLIIWIDYFFFFYSCRLSFLPQDLGHPMGSQFGSSSPVTIDVPLGDMSQGLLGSNQLTTIDQSELSAQLGLGLGGGNILQRPHSPENPLSATASPTSSLQDDDMDDFRRVGLQDWKGKKITKMGSVGDLSQDYHLTELIVSLLWLERTCWVSGLPGRLSWSHLPRPLFVRIPGLHPDFQHLLGRRTERRGGRREERA